MSSRVTTLTYIHLYQKTKPNSLLKAYSHVLLCNHCYFLINRTLHLINQGPANKNYMPCMIFWIILVLYSKDNHLKVYTCFVLQYIKRRVNKKYFYQVRVVIQLDKGAPMQPCNNHFVAWSLFPEWIIKLISFFEF